MTIKTVATTARDAMTIKHCFTTPIDEQGWASVVCTRSVTLVGFAVLVDNILPPCVPLVATEIDAFVDRTSAVVGNADVRMRAPVVDGLSIGDSVVAERFLVFSRTDPVVTFTLEAGSSVVALDSLNASLVMFWICLVAVTDAVVSFGDVVVANPSLLFCGNTVDMVVITEE